MLACLLYLHQDNLTLGVLGLYVHTVILVVLRLLVRLGVEQLYDGNLFFHQHGDKPLEDGEVGLVAKHVLRGPVKADISVLSHRQQLFFATKVIFITEMAKQFPNFLQTRSKLVIILTYPILSNYI